LHGLTAEDDAYHRLARATEHRSLFKRDPARLEPGQTADPARGEDCANTEQDEPNDHRHAADSHDVESAAAVATPIEPQPVGDLARQLVRGETSGLRAGGIPVVGHRQDLSSNMPQPDPTGREVMAREHWCQR
jgi:hypothetical protein